MAIGPLMEFKLYNFQILSDLVGKIQQAARLDHDKSLLSQVIQQIFSDQQIKQDEINRRINYLESNSSAVFGAEYFVGEDSIKFWCRLVDQLKPCFHVSTMQTDYFEDFIELANLLELDECWSRMEFYHEIFLHDIQHLMYCKYGNKEDSNGKFSDLSAETKKLIREEPYYELMPVAAQNMLVGEYGAEVIFIHPFRMRKFSEKLQHATKVPRSLLREKYMNEYNEYLNDAYQTGQEKESIITIEEFIESKRGVDTLDDILQYYNDPKFVFSLIERPVMDLDPVQRIWNEEIHTDYWILIMEFIGDPFTLARLGMTCPKLYQLFLEKKDNLFNSEHLKKDIGLFIFS